MLKEPPTIVAINPGTRYIAFACLSGPELDDWGVKDVRDKTVRGKLSAASTILVEILDRFSPNMIVAKMLHSGRSSGCLNDIAYAIQRLAESRKLSVQQYSIGQLKKALCPNAKANKWQLAEQIVAMHPALTLSFQKELANRNPYFLRVLEAVALGVVGYPQSERVKVNQNK